MTLGKRKRRAEPEKKKVAATADSDSDDDAEARALFQKAFEAKFKPLEVQPVRDEDSDEDDSDDHDDESADESDWDGISEDEDTVEIVEHAQPDMDAIFGGLKNGKNSYMVGCRNSYETATLLITS